MLKPTGLVSRVIGSLLLFITSWAYALPPMNMPEGVTPVSHEIYSLHMLVFYICCGIGVVVFTFLFYSLIKFRRSKGAESKPFHEHLGIEILWTVIPFILLVIMAVPATKVLYQIHNTEKPDLNIKITGYQWKWQYDYLDQGINFYSNISTPQDEIHNIMPKNPNYLLQVDHPLIVPVKEKIRFLITANDVVHSWWVPELGIKQDAIPGYINDAWAYIEKPGTYRGQCAELCGAMHAYMPIVVKAVSQADFKRWVQKQENAKYHLASNATPATPTVTKSTSKPLSEASLMKVGQEVYAKHCVACHQKNLQGMPPTFPSLVDSKIVHDKNLTPLIDTVLNGVPNTAMQAFKDQLSDEEIAGVLNYIRNAGGKHSRLNPTVADIQAAKKHIKGA